MSHALRYWAAYVAAVDPSRVPEFWGFAERYTGETAAYCALHGLKWSHRSASYHARQACRETA